MNNETLFRGYKLPVLFVALVLTLVTIAGVVISYMFGLVYVVGPGFINVVSLLGFIGLCFLGLISYRVYFLLLPFIFLAFPAAADDFFPSVYLGEPSELGASLFPFITHIDIYLIIGILKKIFDQRNKFRIYADGLSVLVMVLFLLSSLINMVVVRDPHQFALIVCGLFPLRYLVLLSLLISNYEIQNFERPIINGIIFSVFFLLLESSVNSYINRTDVLSSGTLASNTFANITAAILVFVTYLKRKDYQLNFFLYAMLLGAGVAIILLTETRMAILAGIVSFFLIQLILFKWRRTFLVLLTLGVLVVVVYNRIEVPDRYSVRFLLSKIQFNYFSWNIFDMISIERSWETSSIFSRLKLYQTSVNMFFDSPFWGTGYGTFNYLKNSFGFDEYVLIDAHNGYLNTLAQMGISSLFFLYFIYLYPIFSFKKIKGSTFLKYLIVINFTMAIADLSNAGIYKPSVFALLAFNCFVIMALKRDSHLSATGTSSTVAS